MQKNYNKLIWRSCKRVTWRFGTVAKEKNGDLEQFQKNIIRKYGGKVSADEGRSNK